MMRNECIETKNRLLALLNKGATTDEILQNYETVLTVLENTRGLWADLEYTYKAVEILRRIEDDVDGLLREKLKIKTKRKAEFVKFVAIRVQNHYATGR